jgi:hypothetical protein
MEERRSGNHCRQMQRIWRKENLLNDLVRFIVRDQERHGRDLDAQLTPTYNEYM